MVIWKGRGILGLLIVGLASYLVKSFSAEYLPNWSYSNLSLTLFVAAVLMLPLSILDFKNYLKIRKFEHSIFFIPICIFPVVLVALGYVYLNYQR